MRFYFLTIRVVSGEIWIVNTRLGKPFFIILLSLKSVVFGKIFLMQ